MEPTLPPVPSDHIPTAAAPSPLGVDAVLLIDGDNDPHFPPDFEITERTVVRVFLRMGAKMSRTLEKRLAHLPNCIVVTSPQTSSNAADFCMAMHAGILHATLPMSLPFTVVTNDKALGVTVQELQRVGRQTFAWTSHPERRGGGGGRGRGRQAKPAAAEGAAAAPASSGSRRRGGRRGGRGRAKPVSARAPALEPQAAPAAEKAAALATAAVDQFELADIAEAYAARLARVKDPPSRLKALLNDIANRAAPKGMDPQTVVEELKRIGVVTVDGSGRVKHHVRPQSD